MNEPYYMKVDREAAETLKMHLQLPLPVEKYDIGVEGYFDPWEIFPCFYGSYSSEFDDLAIAVLENIRDRVFTNHGLAEEMFREYLCRFNLCDYGVSPRGCFPSENFRPLLPELIEKWKAYRAIQWGGDE